MFGGGRDYNPGTIQVGLNYKQTLSKICSYITSTNCKELCLVDCRDQYSKYRRSFENTNAYLVVFSSSAKDIYNTVLQKKTMGIVIDPFDAAKAFLTLLVDCLLTKKKINKLHVLSASQEVQKTFYMFYTDGLPTFFYNSEIQFVQCVDKVSRYNGPKANCTIEYTLEATPIKNELDDSLVEFKVGDKTFIYDVDETAQHLKVVQDNNVYHYIALDNIIYSVPEGAPLGLIHQQIYTWNEYVRNNPDLMDLNIELSIEMLSKEQKLRADADETADMQNFVQKVRQSKIRSDEDLRSMGRKLSWAKDFPTDTDHLFELYGKTTTGQVAAAVLLLFRMEGDTVKTSARGETMPCTSVQKVANLTSLPGSTIKVCIEKVPFLALARTTEVVHLKPEYYGAYERFRL